MQAFTEKQNFLKKWWILIIAIFLVTILPTLLGLGKNAPAIAFVAPISVNGLIFLLFASLTLHTRIDETNISVRFAPFHFKPKLISWNDVNIAKVVKYDPLFEYGGYGIRKKWGRNAVAYNVSGKFGLELHLNNGKKILIGTEHKEEMDSYLNYLKSKYDIKAIGADKL